MSHQNQSTSKVKTQQTSKDLDITCYWTQILKLNRFAHGNELLLAFECKLI